MRYAKNCAHGRTNLWEAQKRCEAGREEWLERDINKQARAAGDDDWERSLTEMIRHVEDRSINRKLTAITKDKIMPER